MDNVVKLEDGCYGSYKGIALIGKVLAGRCKMHYTRVAVGKGRIPEGMSPKELLEPPEYVMDAMIASVTNPVDGECQVSVQINSAFVKSGFYATWLILYAEDPDEDEVPFTALCLENEPEWLRPASSIVGKLAHFDMIAAVGDVDKVTATIDADALVTYGELAKIIRGIAAGAAQKDINIPVSGWIADTDTNGAFDWMLDIASMDIKESMVPLLTFPFEHLEAAASFGICQASRTMPGALRIYSKTVPTYPITASLSLFETECEIGNSITPSAAVARVDIAIPTEGWAEITDPEEGSGVYIDVPCEEAEPDLIPLLTFIPAHLGLAEDCGLTTYAKTARGALRVYAQCPPSSDINASLTLLGVVHNIDDKLPSEGGGAYVVPTATANRAGVMKVGDGLVAAPDGTVSVAKATDEEVEGMLNRVYSDKKPATN